MRSNAAATPFPKSPRGRDPLERGRLLAGHDRHDQPQPHAGRPRRAPLARDPADLDHVPEPGPEVQSPPSRCGGPGGARGRSVPAAGSTANSTGCSRSRSSVARTTSTSPAKSEPWTSCTFFPGRTSVRSMRSGANGTGRISSRVKRAGNVAVPSSKRSSRPASSADGAPPCWA